MSCSSKVAYSSERRAKQPLRSIRHPHGVMHAYRCGDHWHLGHRDALERKRWRR